MVNDATKRDTPPDTLKGSVSRVAALEKTVSSLKKQVSAVALLGLLLGGGGVFGLMKWAYSAPNEAANTAAKTKVAKLQALVTSHTTTIESLERTIKRMEEAGNAKDDGTIKELRERVEETERRLREALDQFNAATESLASITGQLNARSKELSAVAADVRQLNEKTHALSQSGAQVTAVRTELLKHIDSIYSSLDSQKKELRAATKAQTELISKIKDRLKL